MPRKIVALVRPMNRSVKNHARHQRGVALLTVLLMLSLLVVMANELTLSFREQLGRSHSLLQRQQARWYAISSEALAEQALRESFKKDSKVTNLDQYWAMEERQFPVDGGFISGKITDAQSCFNVNALSKPSDTSKAVEDVDQHRESAIFEALLTYLGVPDYEAKHITVSTRNWVSDEQVPNGAVDDDYLALPMPYLSSRTWMRDVTEWRAVAGVSAAVANKILPYLCALPSDQLAVNVNTIAKDHPELLAALFIDQLPEDQAKNILEDRPQKGWATVSEFAAQPLLSNFNTKGVNSRLTTVSHYFQMDASASFGESSIRLSSLTVRSNKDDLVVVRRKFGGV